MQLHGSDDLQANLERCRRWIKESVERGAELVLLPEDFAFLARGEQDKHNLTSAQLSRILETIREEALRHSVHVLAGGYPVRVEGEEHKLYNRATLFSPDGTELAHYEKLHLFDADPPVRRPCESPITSNAAIALWSLTPRFARSACRSVMTCVFLSCIGPWLSKEPSY